MTTLVNDHDKHNKFWSYELDELNVHTTWGRLGTKKNSKSYSFGSSHEASQFASKKMYEKQRKGYREVDDEEFGLMKVNAELLGSNCKLVDICFVENVEKICSWAPEAVTKFKKLTTAGAIARPSYKPVIYASIQFRQFKNQSALITQDKVFSCSEVFRTLDQVGLMNIAEIGEYAPKELLSLKKKAPGLVDILFR